MMLNEATLVYLGGADALEPEYDTISLIPQGGAAVVAPGPLTSVVTLNTDSGMPTVTLTSDAPPGTIYDVYVRDGRTGELSKLSLSVTVVSKPPPAPPSPPPPSPPPSLPPAVGAAVDAAALAASRAAAALAAASLALAAAARSAALAATQPAALAAALAAPAGAAATSPPPSPPPPSPPPPAPPPLILVDGGNAEVAILDTQFVDFRFTGTTIAVGDWVLLVRKDTADANVGNECPTAFATLSTTSTYPDHGGKVEFDSGGFPSVTVTLPGVIDAIDPLTTDNESPTGTVLLMHTPAQQPRSVLTMPRLCCAVLHVPRGSERARVWRRALRFRL